MPGRKPKPRAIRLLEGNAGHRPLNRAEPLPDRGVPSCPKHLPKDAKKTFRKVGRVLDDAGIVTKADGLALELLVSAYHEYRDARQLIREAAEVQKYEDGQAVETRDGLVYKTLTEAGVILRPHPANAIATNAWRRTAAMLSEFGLTPASRTRVHGVGDGREDDPLERFLNGGSVDQSA